MDRLHQLMIWANPKPEDRLLLDLSNQHVLGLPLPILILQAHLLLRYPLNRFNHLIRFLLIFPAVLLAFRSGFAYRFKLDDQVGNNGLQCYNVALGINAAISVAKSLELGLTNTRPGLRDHQVVRRKNDEGNVVSNGKHPGSNDVIAREEALSTSSKSITNGSSLRSRSDKKSNSSQSPKSDATPPSTSFEPLPLFFPESWFPLELDLILSLRGLGWDFGIDSPAGSGRIFTWKDKQDFILKRVGLFLLCMTLLDLLDSTMKNTKINPAMAGVGGGSVFRSQEGVFGIFGPPILTLLLGFVVYAAIQGWYAMLSVVFVLLGSSPDHWSPLPFSKPWAATSLRTLWARHWHSLFRRSFLFLAYFPVRKVTRSKALGVLSTFILSGILHETGQWSMIRPRPLDVNRMWGRTTLFFFLQGVGTVAEEAWEMKSGFKVGGVMGWLWTYGWLSLTGVLASDMWFRLGTANSFASMRLTEPLVEGLVGAIERWS